MTLDQAFQELRERNEPVPKPLRLPTPAEVAAAESVLGMDFPSDYRRFLLEASDVSCGVLEPGLVLPDLPPYLDLAEIARDGWSMGIPRDSLPFCPDNGNCYFIDPAGTVRYWDHDAQGESGRYATLAEWIEEDWLSDNQ